jgi:hypothetical protein
MMARLVALTVFGVLVSCGGYAPLASPTPGLVAGACQQTPESGQMGRVGGNLAARGFRADRVTAAHELKVLWFLRTPHEGLGLRLAMERLDGQGSGHITVTDINRAGSGERLPEWSAAFPSNLTFDVAGCWRIRDVDGSDADAVVVEVRPN